MDCNKKNFFIELSIYEFIKLFPKRFSVLPVPLQVKLASDKNYIVRLSFQNETVNCEIGYRDDNWIIGHDS